MGMVGDKWLVQRGDCLWNIAKRVYGNALRWPEIAAANGRKTTGNPIIYDGEYLVIPGITSGSGSPGPEPAPSPPPITRPNIDWFSLTTASSAQGADREMIAIWSYGHDKFWIRWEQWDNAGHLIMLSEQKGVELKQATYSGRNTPGWNVIRFSVRPVDNDGNPLPNTDWAYKEYDYRNNPPLLPEISEFEIDENNTVTITFNNIDANINADNIEIAIYQDDTNKYRSATIGINKELHFAKYVGQVDEGHKYKVRARGIRGNIQGGWCAFTENQDSLPVCPSEITTLRTQKISDQQAVQYAVLIEWPAVDSAKQYEIQYTTNVEYFDTPSSEVHSQTTNVGDPTRLLISDVDLGHTWFFRIRSINDKGNSKNFTPIKSIVMGTKPDAPTTWSNVSSAIIGEDLNLYWKHNSTDGSYETWARIHITTIDSLHPELEPMEYIKTVENTRPEEQKDQNGVYTINTNDPEWAGLLEAGFIIKWKVQTAGVNTSGEGGGYSDWSIEREVNVYAQPTITLDMTNKDGWSIEEVNGFPFYFNVLSGPPAQTPISYHIEIISNDTYDTNDEVGNVKAINAGDKVYEKYYDPERNAWEFLLEMTPAIIDLKSGRNYTVNITVGMNSGLSATASKTFDVQITDSWYYPYADVIIDKQQLSANIHPYCMENYVENDEIKQRLTTDCIMSVYRREYDGTFTEIAKNIENDDGTYVNDPHPSLDYARYRIIAKANETGTMSYCDIDPIKIGEPSLVIQWAEDWSNLGYDVESEYDREEIIDNEANNFGPGSILRLPYNVDTSENRSPDVSLVSYVGRKNPVSYYGTQIGETGKFSAVIAASDKDTLYSLRRLARFTGDVYIREPSGTGYWANVKVSMSTKHTDLTIPVSIDATRVEGGM